MDFVDERPQPGDRYIAAECDCLLRWLSKRWLQQLSPRLRLVADARLRFSHLEESEANLLAANELQINVGAVKAAYSRAVDHIRVACILALATEFGRRADLFPWTIDIAINTRLVFDLFGRIEELERRENWKERLAADVMRVPPRKRPALEYRIQVVGDCPQDLIERVTTLQGALNSMQEYLAAIIVLHGLLLAPFKLIDKLDTQRAGTSNNELLFTDVVEDGFTTVRQASVHYECALCALSIQMARALR